MTLLVFLFAASRNLLFGVFLQKKVIMILQKIIINFKQVSLKDVLFAVKVR